MDWYYARNGEQGGPVDQAELETMAQDGRLAPDDLVWNETMGDEWVTAASQRGLFPAAAGTGAMPPTPYPRGGGTHNHELMRQARECLTGYWGMAISAMIAYQAIGMAVAFIPDLLTHTRYAGGIVSLIVMPPLYVGLSSFFLALARHEEAAVGDIFGRFNSIGTSIGASLLMMIFIMAWSCLLIIPGIVAMYAYAMTFFVIADDPNIGPLEAISRSKALMRGHKWKLFCLSWRFFGWMIVGILTFGIAFLWIGPYMRTATARFYDDLLTE